MNTFKTVYEINTFKIVYSVQLNFLSQNKHPEIAVLYFFYLLNINSASQTSIENNSAN